MRLLLQTFPKIPVQPIGIGEDELQGKLVVGQVDSVVVTALLPDALPAEVGYGAFEFGEIDHGIARLHKDDIAVSIVVSWEISEDFLDDGSGWVFRGKLGDVGSGLEGEHDRSS